MSNAEASINIEKSLTILTSASKISITEYNTNNPVVIGKALPEA